MTGMQSAPMRDIPAWRYGERDTVGITTMSNMADMAGHVANGRCVARLDAPTFSLRWSLEWAQAIFA